MNLETFYDNFELLAESPKGVPKLRELILQLAVQGKLVPQNPNDESASILFTKISAEKERQFSRKKSSKALLPFFDNSVRPPYELPNSWIWLRLDKLCDIGTGSTPLTTTHDYYEGGEIPFITSSATSQDFIDKADLHISESALTDYRLKLYPPGTLLVAMYGQGKTRGQISQLEISATINQALAAITFYDGFEVVRDYIRMVFKKKYDELRSMASGGAQPNLNVGKIKETLIPLPPLEEQKRIVARVDQLMKLCDELEERQQKKREARTRLNESALEHLLAASNPEDFNSHWQRICDNFELLYDKPETIGKLRQSILQLAVQGKLVKQDPNDEPASVLIEKIKAEKERLIKENTKAVSNNKSLQIKHGEMPFVIPASWRWILLEEIYEVAGGIQKTPKRLPIKNYFPYLRVANVYRGRLDLREIEYFELVDGELEKRMLKKWDLLVVEGNGSENEIGRCAIWDGQIPNCVHQNHLIRCRPINQQSSLFTLLFLNSYQGMSEMKKLSITTAGLYSLSVGKIRQIAIPFPPIAEQLRIVAKVDQLMKLCDALEAKLKQAQTLSSALMASTVNHLFSSAIENEPTISAALSV